MSVVSVQPKDFILALFIRDDGERFLLGDKGYDFTDSQLHFAANTIENDEVEKQGADGTMLAGQVRRASVQTFDGYVGDATTPKEEIEQMRRAFIAFFLKGHHYRVIYVDCARNAWQRKGGYLVDAPEVKELFQVHPEYHVGLNFEDVNYYSYDENAEGDEITANLVQVAISSAVEGGLVWDEDGAVSEDATVVYDGDTATASGANISINDAVMAPIVGFGIKGETSQNGTPTPDAPVPVQTVTGENVVKISDGQGNEQSYTVVLGSIELCGLGDDGAGGYLYQDYIYKNLTDNKWYVRKEVGSYTFDGSEAWARSGSTTSTVFVAATGIYLGDYIQVKMGEGSQSLFDRFTFNTQQAGAAGRFNLYNGTDYYQSLAISFDIADIPDITAAKAWLASNTPTLYGVLATPTDTEITNEALIEQLEAILSQGYTYAGTNNITTVITAGNEQGELEIEYYTRYEFEITAGGYVWEEGGSGGHTTVMNESIDNVYPIWTITGPITNPVLENTTTGEQIEYVGTIGDGQTLVIDMGAQTALLDGLNVVANIVGEFLSLAPGSNTLIYSVDSGDKASEIGWSEIVG